MEIITPGNDFFKFIEDNINEDTSKLRLKFHNKNTTFNLPLALIQIECRKKCVHKLPSFLSNRLAIFPDVVASEQASHEAVANYHSVLAQGYERILDMTAGLGIDSLAFAKAGYNVVSCELNDNKAACLDYNKNILNLNSLKVENTDSLVYLKETDNFFDMIFIDPARRGEGNSRVYNFKDCRPDIIQNINLLLSKAKSVIIKASPLLDISQTLKDIPHVKSIRAISVHGECKEILIEASAQQGQNTTDDILAEAIDLANDSTIFSKFSYIINPSKKQTENKDNISNNLYANKENIVAGSYLYEPNATMMKLAPWKELSTRFPSLKKFSDSTHLFVSEELLPDFPGRKLLIKDVPDKGKLKNLKNARLNVVTRNYPISADELRKKLNLKEGSDDFLYAGKIKSIPMLILATRI